MSPEPHIELVCFVEARNLDLEMLARKVQRTFRLPTRISSNGLDPLFAYDRQRSQYFSTRILERLLEERPVDALKIVGITNVDLFIPILTFVFGEAQLDGPAAVVSACRLHPTFYGLPSDDRLLDKRLAKETIHELGHTFGLIHCQNQACVMSASPYADRIDLKSEEFCLPCRRLLNSRLETSVLPG